MAAVQHALGRRCVGLLQVVVLLSVLVVVVLLPLLPVLLAAPHRRIAHCRLRHCCCYRRYHCS